MRGHAAHAHPARPLRVSARLVSYREHNGQGGRASWWSACGAARPSRSPTPTPLVSDPGYVLVRDSVAAGLEVEVLPGPSAALAALVASALPADRWRFAGFLPRRKGDLRELLAEPGGTLVAFESPRRVPATLAVLAELEPSRAVAVCRELTKAHEEVVRGTAAELAGRYAGEPPRGEGGPGGGPGRRSGRRGGGPGGPTRSARGVGCERGRRRRWWRS